MTTTTIDSEVLAMATEGMAQTQIAKRLGISRWQVRQALGKNPGGLGDRYQRGLSDERRRSLVRDVLVRRRDDASWRIAKCYGVSSSYVRMVRCGMSLADVLPDLPRSEVVEISTAVYCAWCVHFSGDYEAEGGPCSLGFPEGGRAAAEGCAAYFERKGRPPGNG